MHVLGIAGTARSGKSSTAKYLLGNIMLDCDIIKKFEINDDGDLLVNASYRDEKGKFYEDMGIFDIDRSDEEFISYMRDIIWPNCKIYNFADVLKWIAIKLYGLKHENVYGNTQQKDSSSPIKWAGLYGVIPKEIRPSLQTLKVTKNDFITNRQFLQGLGDALRFIDDLCLVKYTINEILEEQSPLSIIADVRRPEEVAEIRRVGGKVIYLKRNKDVPQVHSIELGFTESQDSDFDAVVDNSELSMYDKNNEVYKIVREWGWI